MYEYFKSRVEEVKNLCMIGMPSQTIFIKISYGQKMTSSEIIVSRKPTKSAPFYSSGTRSFKFFEIHAFVSLK